VVAHRRLASGHARQGSNLLHFLREELIGLHPSRSDSRAMLTCATANLPPPRALDAWDHVIVGRPRLLCNTRLLDNMFEAIGDQANVKHFLGILTSQRPGYMPIRLMVEKMPDRGDET
jgi:hypothetical protein